MNQRVEFLFDLSSPYSYLAATQIPGLAQRTGAEIVWKPMMLAPVFKGAQNTMPMMCPAKGTYMLKDLARWAATYRVPFRFSSRFPMNTLRMMRTIVAAESHMDPHGHPQSAALALRAFRALWEEDRDLTDPAVQSALLVDVGLDPQALLSAAETPPVKDRLKSYGDEALARGVFGAPSFLIGDELFWGNDRLSFVEEFLRR